MTPPKQAGRPPASTRATALPVNTYRGQRTPAARPSQERLSPYPKTAPHNGNGQAPHNGRGPDKLPPGLNDPRSEAAVLGIMLNFCTNSPEDQEARRKILALPPSTFFDLRWKTIFEAAQELDKQGMVPDIASVTEQLIKSGKASNVQFLSEATGAESSTVNLDWYLERLENARRRRELHYMAQELDDYAQNPDFNPSDVAAMAAEALRRCGSNESAKGYAARAFNPTREPPPLRERFKLAGRCVATPGNLCSLVALPKAGKTAFVGAMAASTFSPQGDFLGISSDGNPQGLPILYFDTEQAPDDFWHCIKRICRRAGLEAPPPWFYAYCLTGLTPLEARQAVRLLADKHAAQRRLHSVFVDGIGDLVADVNDPAESVSLICELHDLAIQYDCAIISVLHLNPAGPKEGTGRGHLGSQLERKAESNLRLEQTEDAVCLVWSTKQRRAPIPRSQAVTFRWDDEQGMHVACDYEPPKLGRPTKGTAEECLTLLKARGPMTVEAWVEQCEQVYSISRATAFRRLRELEAKGAITHNPDGTLIAK